jgi:hypothetical protein
MKNLAKRIKDVLIEMAIDDTLPLDLTDLDMDTILEKAVNCEHEYEAIFNIDGESIGEWCPKCNDVNR